MSKTVFASSLINSGTGKPDLILSSDCLSIAVTDNSNFTTSNENGFDATSVYVDYRKIFVTHQSGKQFIMSTQAGGDQLILPAASGINTFDYVIGFGDGVYSFQLINIPTWLTIVQYTNMDSTTKGQEIVYNPTDGLLYKNILGANTTNQANQPDLSPTYWAVITEADALLSRFATTEKISVLCQSNVCYENNIVSANCSIVDGCNDEKLCKNKYFLNAMKINCLSDGIIWASNKGNFNQAENYFNALFTICNCG